MKKASKKAKRRPFSWAKRESDLEGVKRYHAMDVMFYRTNLLVHSRRVPSILERLLPAATASIPGFNPELARLISKHHDDFELIPELGDVPLQLKLLMDKTERSALQEAEIAAAKKLSADYGNPTIGDYRYINLLMHAILKDCPEAQLHSLADKIEGFSEAIHEVLAGNVVFFQPAANYVKKTFSNLLGNYPLIAEVLGLNNGLFDFPTVQLAPYFNNGRTGAFLHTKESVTRPTGIIHYELWREVTLSLPGGLDLLTIQTEFHQ